MAVQGGRRVGSAAVVNVVFIALGLLALLHGAQATTYVVGGSIDWTYAPNGSPTYYNDVWAKGKTFRVGDVLEFVYTPPTHNVYELANQTAYDSCDLSSPVTTKSSGNDKFTLSSAGTWFFVCGVPTHCSTYGMKVSVLVSAASGTPATPAPVSTAPPTPAPVSALPPTAKAPVTPSPPPPVVPAPAPATTPATPTGAPSSSVGTPASSPAVPPSSSSPPSLQSTFTPLVAAALFSSAAAIFFF